MFSSFAALALLATSVVAHNFVVSNDGGWATAQARAQYNSLVTAGFDVVLSAPAVDRSGQGTKTQTPVVLQTPCQFNTCPKGSPAEGYDATDPRLNYVNGFGPDAMKYGIQTLAPKYLGGPPDIAISGPTMGGTNFMRYALVNSSSAFQTAVEAVKLGIPAVAFFGGPDSTTQISYTTLTTNPNSTDTTAALMYADLVAKFTGVLWNSGAPYLASDVVLAVNFPSIAGCSNIDDYKFVMAKFATHPITTIQICGDQTLPLVDDVMAAKGCFASVTALNALHYNDLAAEHQQLVMDKIGTIISCL